MIVLGFLEDAAFKRTDDVLKCRAVIYNLNFELYSEVITDSTKLGSIKWEGSVGGNNLVSFSNYLFG